MAEEFQLDIVTPERVVFSDKVRYINARGSDGRFGIMYDHHPLVTKLLVAPFTFTKADGEQEGVSITGSGFLEVAPEKVTVLCDTAELSSEINVERAQEAKQRAEKRLEQESTNMDYARAEASLRRAVARIRVAGADEEENFSEYDSS